jgi:hypothetical protein
MSQDLWINQAASQNLVVADRLWTKAEMEARNSLLSSWSAMVNDTCHRNGFLRDLGEFKLNESERQTVDKSVCCSACNPDLNPDIIYPPACRKAPAAPRAGTLAAAACV